MSQQFLVRVIAKLCHYDILSVANKNGIKSLDVAVSHIKKDIRWLWHCLIGFIVHWILLLLLMYVLYVLLRRKE